MIPFSFYLVLTLLLSLVRNQSTLFVVHEFDLIEINLVHFPAENSQIFERIWNIWEKNLLFEIRNYSKDQFFLFQENHIDQTLTQVLPDNKIISYTNSQPSFDCVQHFQQPANGLLVHLSIYFESQMHLVRAVYIFFPNHDTINITSSKPPHISSFLPFLLYHLVSLFHIEAGFEEIWFAGSLLHQFLEFHWSIDLLLDEPLDSSYKLLKELHL